MFVIFHICVCINESVKNLLVLCIFGSAPKPMDADVFDGVCRPSEPPTVLLFPLLPMRAFPDVTVIDGVSDDGEGIAGGGLDVTY